ncbi:MAG: NAD-dependent epimerase/dehydratase family protein [Candidatus Eremiobacteraeota bacterium]|nr:NAD-dependent epimerase/dehydratase family protein [Candidatus Eremiobacteraeota bacterium]
MLHVVTGGAGFLGSHLVDALIERGDDVLIVDNLTTGNLRNVENATRSGRAAFVFLDVAQPVDVLRAALEAPLAGRKIDRIYHLASPASPDAYGNHPWETLLVNGLGTMSLIELALLHGARFVYSSTSEIYGDPLVHPQPESYFGNVDPIGPRACYDEGKRFGEAAISVAFAKSKLDARIVRFFNCYGPRMNAADGRLIPALTEAVETGRPFPIHGDGRQTRSMTYVSDAIALLLIVSDTSMDRLQPVNIGNDVENTVLEIAEAFARASNVPFTAQYEPAREGDPKRRRPDLSVARTFPWNPKVSLDEGLALSLAWSREVSPAYL